MNRLEFFFAAGRLFSPFYGAAMLLRSRLYQSGVFRRRAVAAPVLSVGNLTWGGTGKTPLVIEVARFAREQGWQPAIVSRGYGGSVAKPVNVVSDGKSVLLRADEAGDEPRFLAESLPGVPVVTGKRRILPARYAVESLGADLILLDDGFQHLALQRQLDIVLFRSDAPLGNGRVFPAGQLREPLSALARADCFVLTGCPPENREQTVCQFTAELQRLFPGRPVFSSFFRVDRVLQASEDNAECHPDSLRGQRLFLFSGIGNPQSFHDSLLQTGAMPGGIKTFSDHHRYDQADVDAIAEQCRKTGCSKAVTTEKDYVKVRQLQWTVPLIVVKGRTVVEDGFFPFLRQRLLQLGL